ncbi:site-specific integrase [Arthrobacter sp. CDRTa11]|uniref:site-specific integrase n=1 Tax=Arthrobacter sp. CDRTa11 TaxID=2651199 RepID=UPI002265BF54|nr:site-specific integrase [Arthrobacter sp. CDRTa11]
MLNTEDAKEVRNPRGEGSIKPYSGGGYRVRLTVNGVKKSKLVATPKEGRDQVRAWKNQSDEGLLISGAKSELIEVIEGWFREGCKDNPNHKDLAISTIQGYRQKTDAYIAHAPIAHIRMNSLTAEHIGSFIRSLANGEFAEHKTKTLTKELNSIKITDPLQSQKRIRITAQMPKRTEYGTSIQRQCYAVIRDALKFAVAQRLVSRNVAVDYAAPGAQTNSQRDAGHLTREEERHGYELSDLQRWKVLAALDEPVNARMKLRWTLALIYGVRPGEALGICFSDVDYGTKELVIRRQLQPVTGRGNILVPRVKTPSGKRTIPLRDDTLQLFKEASRRKRREKRSPNWTQYEFDGREYDLVFTQLNGRSIPQRLDDTNWKRFLKSAGVPEVRRYVARHDAASQMMAKPGVDHIAVSSILGHSDPSFTWRKYSHALEGKKRSVIDAMGNSVVDSVFAWKERLEEEHGRAWMIENNISPNEWDEDGELVS